jgi:4-carboxymuconolactone decarboxylase
LRVQHAPRFADGWVFAGLRELMEEVQQPGNGQLLANPKLLQTIVPTGAYFQTDSTLTKAEIEIATSLINARWLAAYSNYEHEMIAEKAGGLPPEKVEAII